MSEKYELSKNLNSCPFCGGYAILDIDYMNCVTDVFCQKCSATIQEKTVDKAIEAWNRRTPQ